MFYKMFIHLAEVPYQQYTSPSILTSTRGYHNCKLIPLSCRKNPFKYSFFPRTIPTWNDLPYDVINCDTLDFKYKLDNYYTVNNFNYLIDRLYVTIVHLCVTFTLQSFTVMVNNNNKPILRLGGLFTSFQNIRIY